MRADKQKVEQLVKTARGQLEGVLRMIEEDRYCIDISTQLLAAEAVIRAANREVLSAHMQGCLIEAAQSGETEQKADELMKLLEKLMK